MAADKRSSWHVRSVPQSIQQAVVDMAHAERISVADMLTRLVTNTADMPVNARVDTERLLKLLRAAAVLRAAALPKAVKNAVKATIVSELRHIARNRADPTTPKER
jgi:hypothetical protein